MLRVLAWCSLVEWCSLVVDGGTTPRASCSAGRTAAVAQTAASLQRASCLVEDGPTEDGAPELRGGGAAVPSGRAPDATAAHRRALPGLPGEQIGGVGIALAQP